MVNGFAPERHVFINHANQGLKENSYYAYYFYYANRVTSIIKIALFPFR